MAARVARCFKRVLASSRQVSGVSGFGLKIVSSLPRLALGQRRIAEQGKSRIGRRDSRLALARSCSWHAGARHAAGP